MMSEMGRKELETRTKAMSAEELEIILKAIPDNALWNELRTRYALMQGRINMIESVVNR